MAMWQYASIPAEKEPHSYDTVVDEMAGQKQAPPTLSPALQAALGAAGATVPCTATEWAEAMAARDTAQAAEDGALIMAPRSTVETLHTPPPMPSRAGELAAASATSNVDGGAHGAHGAEPDGIDAVASALGAASLASSNAVLPTPQASVSPARSGPSASARASSELDQESPHHSALPVAASTVRATSSTKRMSPLGSNEIDSAARAGGANRSGAATGASSSAANSGLHGNALNSVDDRTAARIRARLRSGLRHAVTRSGRLPAAPGSGSGAGTRTSLSSGGRGSIVQLLFTSVSMPASMPVGVAYSAPAVTISVAHAVSPPLAAHAAATPHNSSDAVRIKSCPGEVDGMRMLRSPRVLQPDADTIAIAPLDTGTGPPTASASTKRGMRSPRARLPASPTSPASPSMDLSSVRIQFMTARESLADVRIVRQCVCSSAEMHAEAEV